MDSMQRVKRLAVAFAAALAAAVFTAAPASAQMAKSGQPRGMGSWHSAGTYKDLGEGQASWYGEFWGVSFGQNGTGFLHQMSWYCTGEATWSGGQVKGGGGLCTMTDADSDKVYLRWQPEKTTPAGQFYNRGTYLHGTGKYRGIQGYYLLEGRAAPDSNFIGDFVAGEYKLP
jgi:hypothetical protein